MEDELKRLELKMEQDLAKDKELLDKALLAKDKELLALVDDPVVKKSVFAKFKDYNKDNSKESSGANSTGAKPKVVTKKEVASLYLKENANRYSCDGKIANMQFLKKIERKVTDKNYTMSFADFKLMKTKT
jgi:hypothetical protein